MNLKTKELEVRNFRENDLDALHNIYVDPEVMLYVGGAYENKEETLDEMRCNALCDDRILFAVQELKGKKLIGEVTYIHHNELDHMNEAEIGWILCKDSWNKGYASQLTEALLDYAKKDGATAVFLCCEEENDIPKHIAEKFGMEYIGFEWGQVLYRKEL